ncbi:hypothetical protein [Cetobacterium sp.]|uniref:hypothetical protein n=2 Tax=Cetobacterium sp. TaxID=2071632 RepID=UPI003F2EB2F8
MFLSPGEKILRYRKHYKIKQEELTKNIVSKTYLGMVENGRKVLSNKMALIFYKNLEEALESKGEKIDITYEEFVEKSEAKAKKYLDEILKKEIIENKWLIEEAILKLNRVDQKKIIIELSNLYLKLKDENEARRMYAKLFQMVSEIKKYEQEFIIFLNLCEKYEKYEIILLLFKKYEEDIKKLKKFNEIYYRYIYSEYKLNVIDTENLESKIRIALINLKNGEIKNNYLKILIAISKKEDLDKYILISKEVLKQTSNLEFKFELLCDLAQTSVVNLKYDDLKFVYLKLKKIYEQKLEKEIRKNFTLLYNLGKVTEILNRKNESRKYFIEALIIGKGVEVPLSQVTEIIDKLFGSFEKSDYYSLLSIEEEYLRILKNYEDYKPVIKLLHYYSKNYPQKLDEKFNLFRNYLE